MSFENQKIETILRKSHVRDFTMISNSVLKDNRLSLKAKGFICLLLSLPNDWKICWDYLLTLSTDKFDSLKTIRKELIEHGYLTYKKMRNEEGHFQHIYHIHEEPISPVKEHEIKKMFPEVDFPQVEIPLVVSPLVENPRLLSTKEYKDLKNTNKDIAQTDETSKNEKHHIIHKSGRDSCSQSASPLRTKAICFDFDYSCFKNISKEDVDSWKIAYPSCNIGKELQKMREWCLSNPSKSKAKKHWRKFITNWLSRNDEKISNKEAYQKSNSNLIDKRTRNVDGSPVSSPADGLF